MGKYRMLQTDFWRNPVVVEEMTPEDKLFSLYLISNPHTTQIGIYRITVKQMAFEMGYSLEFVQSLMERFIDHYKLIRYNPETRELAIKYWGLDNLRKGGKPVMDCIYSELKGVIDTSLISYVLEAIQKKEIRDLYESFCEPKNTMENQDEQDTYLNMEEESNDTFVSRHTIRGQKEKQKEKEKKLQKQQQKAFNPNIENNPYLEAQSQIPISRDVQEIVEFWDHNGFGHSNMSGKQQLLSWLENSSFLQPKEVILKAMSIACSNNKRKLNYVVGILKNWENDSLLSVEEIESDLEKQRHVPKNKHSTKSFSGGRAIPKNFILDITAGED
jgi:DnaD/phage-associated family protein